MAVLGIVSEYNPFHNGHLYLLEEARRFEQFDAIICVMSGNFMQRGEPAICDKWARAEMALNCGADLIIELPFCFAIRSANYFARGALQLLHRTGVVTHLAFGCENNHLPSLKLIAEILSREPEEFKSMLKRHLADGLSFPLARSLSLQKLVPSHLSELDRTLLGPNNILAIEYLRVMEEAAIPFIPLAILRQGSSYHDQELSPIASATAIRQALLADPSLSQLATTMPTDSLSILQREIAHGRAPVTIESLEQAIMIKLRTISKGELKQIYEIGEGLEYRFKEAADRSGTLSELIHLVKSKRYSLTRIKRTLLYILFSITAHEVEAFDQCGPQYIHLLGFSAKGQKILQEMKIYSQLSIMSRASDMKKACSKNPASLLAGMAELDRQATDIYSMLYPDPDQRKGVQDYTTSPVRVK